MNTTSTTRKDPLLMAIMGKAQTMALVRLQHGEESAAGHEIAARIRETLRTMPRTYENRGDDAIAYLHYFSAQADFYITELDKGDDDTKAPEQHQAFGSANLGFGAELGYISLIELAENNVELDFYFTPKPLRECVKEVA